MRIAAICLCALTLAGCGRSRIEKEAPPPARGFVAISIENAATNALDWVKLDWSGPRITAGILPAGVSKDTLHVSWPGVSSAKLTFVDDKTRQCYTNDLSLTEANELIRTRKITDVTFRILGYDKAEVVCE